MLEESSSKLRQNAKDQIGYELEQDEIPNQAHHALSSNVIQKLEVDPKYPANLAEKSGYDINNGNNSLLMPIWYGHQKVLNLQRHEGGHTIDYYMKVKEEVEPIYKAYRRIKPCKGSKKSNDLLADLKDAENRAKRKIGKLQWELYDRAKELYNKDYKCEGTGELHLVLRPHDPSTASGLAWLNEEAQGNNIRRRYRIKDARKIVNTRFYKIYGYPRPGSIRS